MHTAVSLLLCQRSLLTLTPTRLEGSLGGSALCRDGDPHTGGERTARVGRGCPGVGLQGCVGFLGSVGPRGPVFVVEDGVEPRVTSVTGSGHNSGCESGDVHSGLRRDRLRGRCSGRRRRSASDALLRVDGRVE